MWDVVFNFFLKKELSLAGTWTHVEMEQLLAACTWQPCTESHQRWFEMFSGLCILEAVNPILAPLQPVHPSPRTPATHLCHRNLCRNSLGVYSAAVPQSGLTYDGILTIF